MMCSGKSRESSTDEEGDITKYAKLFFFLSDAIAAGILNLDAVLLKCTVFKSETHMVYLTLGVDRHFGRTPSS